MRNLNIHFAFLSLQPVRSSARVINRSLPSIERNQLESFLNCNNERVILKSNLQASFHSLSCTNVQQNSLLTNPSIISIARNIPSRTLTKFSYNKGKRKSVKAVLKRFYRLNWGIWIRTYCGRHKKLWKKTTNQKHRLRQHVFCNATQSKLLDKMAGTYWMKPKFYVDDPYEPYHTREEFQFTYKKPKDL